MSKTRLARQSSGCGVAAANIQFEVFEAKNCCARLKSLSMMLVINFFVAGICNRNLLQIQISK